jgi:CheY-like chemotaxis protein
LTSIVPIKTAKGYRRSIMIVDDQATSRTVLKSLINSIEPNAKLYALAGAKEAAALGEKRTMDFVFTDYKLTESDGVRLIRQLKQYPTCSAATFVGVTASEESSVHEALLAAGAVTVLNKPVNKRVIMDVLM